MRLNVHIWCGYKTYVGEKDVCSEKGNSRAFYMDFTDSWSVCICANRCACVRACMRACVRAYSSGEQRSNVCYTPASLGGTSTERACVRACV